MAAEVLGLKFTAVDFIVTENKEIFILEANSAPGLERFEEPTDGPNIEAVKIYLTELLKNYRS